MKPDNHYFFYVWVVDVPWEMNQGAIYSGNLYIAGCYVAKKNVVREIQLITMVIKSTDQSQPHMLFNTTITLQEYSSKLT